MARGPVEVVLEESPLTVNGTKLYFVLIVNIPHTGKSGTLVVTQAWPLEKATDIKEKVEDALSAYLPPPRRRKVEKEPTAVKNRLERVG